ncbi:hypothetical protein SAMD00019534_104650 [Acytostelium subglobosum LB1]|uniref:hypothetical protein n=1 Tax=Acytostelium subglobosum LB1 TaxID=1410327 RepID=UPI0006450E41|nr:hypothetical protein SAMD00019534_104650 [Acytostelium subglobosum LB1]GAM27290.1 hypothetical protein SAMD00019534_104650 [Acytostelium subglobosum LB1]|eukprot:XP_012749757.1 hypothetical protein SAMD00019534_104650 [Acytostelium subglobosum LB1]
MIREAAQKRADRLNASDEQMLAQKREERHQDYINKHQYHKEKQLQHQQQQQAQQQESQK